jgi:hypothetical protein
MGRRSSLTRAENAIGNRVRNSVENSDARNFEPNQLSPSEVICNRKSTICKSLQLRPGDESMRDHSNKMPIAQFATILMAIQMK